MGNIAENLLALDNTKQAIKQAIIDKGQDLTDVPFTQYAEKIANIESGGVDNTLFDFTELLITRPMDREIELTIPSVFKYLGEDVINYWYQNKTTNGLRKINLNKVETVGQQTLYQNRNLIEVNAPNLQNLSYDMFYNCLSIINLHFPNVVDASDGNAFRDCQALKVIEFDKVKTLSGNIFVRCYALDTLVIRTLKVCTLKSTIPTTNTHFADGTASIYVPDDLVEQYKTATNWTTHSSMIKPLSEYVNDQTNQI